LTPDGPTVGLIVVGDWVVYVMVVVHIPDVPLAHGYVDVDDVTTGIDTTIPLSITLTDDVVVVPGLLAVGVPSAAIVVVAEGVNATKLLMPRMKFDVVVPSAGVVPSAEIVEVTT